MRRFGTTLYSKVVQIHDGRYILDNVANGLKIKFLIRLRANG